MLKELSLQEEAREILIKAIEKEPLHWGAWKELASICKTREAVSSFIVLLKLFCVTLGVITDQV